MTGRAAETMREIPAFFSGNQLFEICSNPNYGQCSMYVAGVIDGIFLADGEGGKQSLCRGEITNQGAAELVLSKLSEDSALRSLSAAAAVRAAVAARLSCSAGPVLAQHS
ncbi:Rap1a/Tai family immunity protein [Sphingobium sp. CFD-2]|uniref:Rap1a/Tai family immunity protein n=1 Tax=Sphingobium sp. CFD-2 TaxID=2878542 RepID=UPI00214C2969|nr:Rap1a/Tai family immunity protein [Sphingobium sp. CFD-2]